MIFPPKASIFRSMTDLLLIRHGETRWNTEKRFQGTADSPLTEQGERQARLLAERIAALEPEALYTSDLGRAASTAGIIGAACDLQATPDIRLRERNVGVLTGLTFEVIRDDHAHIWKQYFDRDYIIPDGESLRSVVDRGEAFLDYLTRAHPEGLVAAVSHGAIISALLRKLLHIPADAPRSFSLFNCALNRLEYRGGSWKLTLLGDVSHLEAETAVFDEVQ